jgi:hypothetical protein
MRGVLFPSRAGYVGGGRLRGGVLPLGPGVQKSLCGQSRVDPPCHVVRHTGRARQCAEKTTDLLQRGIDIGTEGALVQMLPQVSRS